MTVWTRKAAEWNSRCFDAKRGRGGSQSSSVIRAVSCPATAYFGLLHE